MINRLSVKRHNVPLLVNEFYFKVNQAERLKQLDEWSIPEHRNKNNRHFSLNYNIGHLFFQQKIDLIKFLLSIWVLTDTSEDSKLVHRQERPKVDTLFSSLFFRRGRATSMTQRRVENTRVHFWTFSPVSVKLTVF